MTKEEILIRNGVLDPKKWDGKTLGNFPLNLTRDTHVHTMKMILLSMDVYGKQQYDQALDDIINIPYSARQGSEVSKLKKL